MCLCVGACSVNLVGDTLFCTCMVCVAFSLLCMFLHLFAGSFLAEKNLAGLAVQ